MTYAADALATFDNTLGTLDHLVGKAVAAGRDDALLAEARLADDMFPLETQLRIAVNQIRLALQRVWRLEIALDETAYDGWATARERLAEAKALVAHARGRDAAPADEIVDYTLPNGMRFVLTAQEYLRDWTLPNLYFHAAIAYGLLRRDGLTLGKGDFVTFMGRYARPAVG